MIELNRSNPVNTFSVYPDNKPKLIDTGSLDLFLQLVQEMDLSTSYAEVQLINSPDNFNWRIVGQVYSSGVPADTGQYNYKLYEGHITDAIWNQTEDQWSLADFAWNSLQYIIEQQIDSGRAFVSGSNEVTITAYLSSDENGAYITYND